MPKLPDVTVNRNELTELVHAVRFAAKWNPHLNVAKRWRLNMLANALEKRARP